MSKWIVWTKAAAFGAAILVAGFLGGCGADERQSDATSSATRSEDAAQMTTETTAAPVTTSTEAAPVQTETAPSLVAPTTIPEATEAPVSGKAQTMCPVMESEINKKLYVDAEGKRIYLCCPACIDVVKKDPAKYIQKLEADGVTLEKTPAE